MCCSPHPTRKHRLALDYVRAPVHNHAQSAGPTRHRRDQRHRGRPNAAHAARAQVSGARGSASAYHPTTHFDPATPVSQYPASHPPSGAVYGCAPRFTRPGLP